jgi:hypothetical protein
MQSGRRLRFAAEALHRLAGQPQAARQDLKRHLAVERHLPCRVHHPHAAAAQLAHHLEVAEPRAARVRYRFIDGVRASWLVRSRFVGVVQGQGLYPA